MEGKKSIFVNLIASIIVFIINVGINFFLTPYLTDKLGAEAYGFISLANNFVSYATILTIALNSMAGRFISIEIHKKNETKASEYFSSVFWANIFIILFLVIPSIICVGYLEKFLNIPENILYDVKILFSFIFLNFYISIISSTYQVSTFATNKMYLQSLKNIEGNILKIAVILFLFILFEPRVFYIGFATLITTIFIFLANIRYKKKLLPNVENKFKLCSFEKVKEVICAGIWNTLTRVGQVLSDGLDLIICNLMIDPLAMGQLAIAKTIGSVVGTLISTVSSVFQPEFIISYANEKKEELIKKLKISMKLTAIFANITFAFILVFGKSFYSLWMPNQDVQLLHILTILTLQGIIVSGIINPMYAIYTVTNKIKVDAICRVIIGFLTTLIVFILLKTTNLGIYAVAGVSIILGTIFNFFFVPTYVAKNCLDVKWNEFYPTIIRYIFTTSIIICIFFIMKNFVMIDTWLELLISILIMGFIGIIINFFILLNKEEKNESINIVKNIIKRLEEKNG